MTETIKGKCGIYTISLSVDCLSKITDIAEKENSHVPVRNRQESVSKMNHFKEEQENILQNSMVESLKRTHYLKHSQCMQEKQSNS